MLETVEGEISIAFITTEQVNGEDVEIGVGRYLEAKGQDIHDLTITIADKK